MNEKEVINKALEILSVNALSKERFSAEIESLEQRLKRSENNIYRLGAIGVTSSGKSTIINSLLGESLLPSAVKPSSSQLVSCHKGDQKKEVIIYFNDGEEKAYTDNDVNSELISQYGEESKNSNNVKNVKQLEIISPSFDLNKNIVLVDSPGLDAFGFSDHEELTMNTLLPTVDFCLFVTTCKTNSDEKMLNVLNVIADYGKPTIIIQNMMDSLRPSLDGKKTTKMVAQEHKQRIEKIIQQSEIKDKASVSIVQMSAIKALEARQNHNEDVLETSGYDLLVQEIKRNFDLLKPAIVGQRLIYLKRELLRISKEIISDSKRSNKNEASNRFEFEGTEENIKQKIEKANKGIESKINSLKNDYRALNDSYEDEIDDSIKSINKHITNCKGYFLEKIKELNEDIRNICDKLHIDSRDLRTDLKVKTFNLSIKKRTVYDKEEVKVDKWQDGGFFKKNIGKFLGHFGVKDTKTKLTSRTETDVDSTIRDAQNKLRSFLRDINKTKEDWQGNLESVKGELFKEIDNRKKAWNARIENMKRANEFGTLGEKLQALANSIYIEESKTDVSHKETNYKGSTLEEVHFPKYVISIYDLSTKLVRAIQRSTIQLFTRCDSRKNFLFGWDEYCEAMFMNLALGVDISEDRITTGRNEEGRVTLFHNPDEEISDRLDDCNIFILVNAVQIGAAITQIERLKLNVKLTANDSLYFVVQDLQEVINGKSIRESMLSIKDIGSELKLKLKPKILVNHVNPLYNLAIVASQENKLEVQVDEIRLLDQLHKRFPYLYPEEGSGRLENNIKDIIN